MTIFLVFVIAAVLIGASYYYNKQKTAKLAAEGKIIERKGGFHEQMQEFTLAPVDPALLTQKLKALPYSDMNVAMSGDSAKQYMCSSLTAGQPISSAHRLGTTR